MKTITISLSIIVIMLFLNAKGQQSMTIFNMQAVPQSNYSNPAIIPEPKFHIGFPGLSSIFTEAGHTGFNAHRFMSVASDDSVEVNIKDLINSMGKYNYVNLSTAYEFLSFGFKVKEKHYFNLALSNKFYTRFCYPRELFEFVLEGNGAFLGETLSFSKLGMNASAYNELMVGYTLKANDKLTLGAHFKYLQGLANLYMKKSEITLLTEQENFFITATSDLDVYASMPEFVWENDTSNNSDPDVQGYLTDFSNSGVAVDFGATYKFSEKLMFGISVIDLGFINWKSGTRNFRSSHPGGSFTFEGIDISEFLDKGDTTSNESKLDNLLDSIVDIFQIDTLYNNYRSPLNTRLYFSASYQFTPKSQLTGLLRLHLYNNAVHPSLTLGYVKKFGNILTLSATYTMANRQYYNFGAGFAANLGPFQIYAASDNIVSPLFLNKYTWTENNEEKSVKMPRSTKFFNVHFGVNFVFGYKPPEENSSIL